MKVCRRFVGVGFLFVVVRSLNPEPKAGKSFETIESQTCEQMKEPEDYFSWLAGCATYKQIGVTNTCLNATEIDREKNDVPEWTLTIDQVNGDSLFRSFDFNDFQNAWMWMNEVAQLAEKNDHHPNWSNLYSSVNVKLTTDDHHCLSSFDFQLAKAMDQLFKPYSIEYVSIVRRRRRKRRRLRAED